MTLIGFSSNPFSWFLRLERRKECHKSATTWAIFSRDRLTGC